MSATVSEPTWRKAGLTEADLAALGPQLQDALAQLREGMDRNPMPPRLAAAFAQAQPEFPPIAKQKTAIVKSKKGEASSYTYKYADLADVVEQIKPILQKYGLAVTQSDGTEGPHVYCVYTRIVHVSGESWLSDKPLIFRAEIGNPQDLGSLYTYLRRYAYCAVMGVVAEDDDDGLRAKREQARSRQERQSRQSDEASETQPDQAPAKEDLDRFWQAIHQQAKILGWTKTETQAWVKDAEPNPAKSTMSKLRQVVAALRAKARANSSSEKPEDPALRKKLQSRWAMLVGDKKMSKEFAWFWTERQFGWVPALDEKTGLTRASARATPIANLQQACQALSALSVEEAAKLQREQADAFALWLDELNNPPGEVEQ